jgi:hypothetical protein
MRRSLSYFQPRLWAALFELSHCQSARPADTPENLPVTLADDAVGQIGGTSASACARAARSAGHVTSKWTGLLSGVNIRRRFIKLIALSQISRKVRESAFT